jgi:hypothetical protein
MTGLQQKHAAEHWLKCAQEVWATACGIKDPKIRHEMEIIARSYERLAGHAERRISHRSGDWVAGLLAEDDPSAKA